MKNRSETRLPAFIAIHMGSINSAAASGCKLGSSAKPLGNFVKDFISWKPLHFSKWKFLVQSICHDCPSAPYASNVAQTQTLGKIEDWEIGDALNLLTSIPCFF